MTDWSTYLEEEQKRIAALILCKPESVPEWAARHRSIRMTMDHVNPDHLAALFYGTVKPPPTRTETIKVVWEEIAARFPFEAGHMGLIATCEHLGDFDFEFKRYGDFIAVECEGVIVVKVPIETVDLC